LKKKIEKDKAVFIGLLNKCLPHHGSHSVYMC